MKMPHHDRTMQAFPDAMHTVKDAVEHIFNLIIGKEDSAKVRKMEMELGRFDLQVEESGSTQGRKGQSVSKAAHASAPFRLTEKEIKLANSRIRSVSLPSPDFTPQSIFTRTYGLKSHDWMEVYTLASKINAKIYAVRVHNKGDSCAMYCILT